MATSSFSPSLEQRSTVDFLSSCPRISGNTNAAAAYTVGPDAGFASRELCVASCARCVFPSATASWFYHYHLQPRPPPPGPTPTRGLQHKNRRKARESPFRQLHADFSGLRWTSHFPLLLLNLIVGLPLAKDTHSHSLRPHKHLMRDGKRMRDMERGVGRERDTGGSEKPRLFEGEIEHKWQICTPVTKPILYSIVEQTLTTEMNFWTYHKQTKLN